MSWKDRSVARLDGEVVVITGASAGIGKETARDLAMRGATIVMGCRDVAKASSVVENFVTTSDGVLTESQFQIIPLDLMDVESIRTFAENINEKFSKVDVLINNAGTIAQCREVNKNGIEADFMTNYLSHFLLTFLLMDAILLSGNGKIINVSSLCYKYGAINFDDLQMEKRFSASAAYCQSKLGNVLFTRSLAAQYAGRVKVYAVHPGVVHSEIYRNMGFLGRLGSYFGGYLFKSAEQGAQSTVYCAVSDQADKQSGLYYSDCKPERLLPHALDVETASRLWATSCQLLNVEWPLDCER